MESLFSIGQKVVCVDSKATSFRGVDSNLIEGKSYIVSGVMRCKCGRGGINVGLTTNYTVCKCGAEFDGAWHNQNRFIPLDFDKAADEAIRESLNESIRVTN